MEAFFVAEAPNGRFVAGISVLGLVDPDLLGQVWRLGHATDKALGMFLKGSAQH
jgi:hypothetical protein